MTTSYYLGVTVKVTDSLSTFIGRSTGTGTVDKLIRRHDVGPIECTSSFLVFLVMCCWISCLSVSFYAHKIWA